MTLRVHMDKLIELINEKNIPVNEHYYNRLIKLLSFLQTSFGHLPKQRSKRIVGYEYHHIIPKSWGGSNKYYNLIQIPVRWHFIVHKFMHKSFPRDQAMAAAYGFMVYGRNKSHINKVSSREYHKVKEQFSLYAKENTRLRGNVGVINNKTGKWELISKESYDKESTEYRHPSLGIKIDDSVKERIRNKFKTGELVSARKGAIAVFDIKKDSFRLVSREEYNSSNIFIPVSSGSKISESHKNSIREFMKTFTKTEGQRESARNLMNDMVKNDILCDCCGKWFNLGNYSQHIYGSKNKGRKASDEQRKQQSDRAKKVNRERGSKKDIFLICVDSKRYITYDRKAAAAKMGISLPTFKKRAKTEKIGTHRNRNILNLMENINLSDYKIYEDGE